AMLIKQINVIGGEPAQRSLHSFANVLGAAVAFARHLLAARDTKAKFGGDHDLATPILERSPEKFLIREGPVHFRRVEEVASQFDGPVQSRNRLFLVRGA